MKLKGVAWVVSPRGVKRGGERLQVKDNAPWDAALTTTGPLTLQPIFVLAIKVISNTCIDGIVSCIVK